MRFELCQRVAFNLVVAAGLVAASPAAAQVKNDWTGGVGFVAKADIQSAFGWNSKQFESRVGALAIDYVKQYQGLVPVISPDGDLDYLPAWVSSDLGRGVGGHAGNSDAALAGRCPDGRAQAVVPLDWAAGVPPEGAPLRRSTRQ